MDRRQFLHGTLGGMAGLAGVIAFPRTAMSLQLSGITRLNDTLSLVTDVGTNVLVRTSRNGSDGPILVDSGAPEFSGSLMKHLAELAPSKRIQTVFNTHYHLENTGANEALGQTGAKILSHASTQEWMATPYWIPAEGRYQKPRPKAAQPTETFYASGSLKVTGEQIDYGYLINAHTS